MILPPLSEQLLTIHTGIQVVSPEESDRLIDKRIEALAWMDENPFASAMRAKVNYLVHRKEPVVIQFKSKWPRRG